jgi:hypothetical protein
MLRLVGNYSLGGGVVILKEDAGKYDEVLCMSDNISGRNSIIG